MMKPRRNLSGYEINQLIKHGMSMDVVDKYDLDMPIEYITGYAQFCSHEFQVTPDTLIPRVETEELVSHVALYARKNFSPATKLTIADIGTGSGCIGLSLYLLLAEVFPLLEFILTDVDAKALKVAKANTQQLIPSERHHQIKFSVSDLLLDLPDSHKIDILVANLPYISHEYMGQLPPSVAKYEPYIALDGKGSKGLGLINKLLNQTQNLIHRPQAIWLELDEYVTLDDLAQPHGYQKKLFMDQFEKVRFALIER